MAARRSSRSSLATLSRIFNTNSPHELRRHAASMWSLCDNDPARIAEWCIRRLELGLYEQGSEEAFLRQVIGSAHGVLEADIKPFRQTLNFSEHALRLEAKTAEQERVKAWSERRKLLAQREEKRRQATSHKAIKQRIAAAPKPAVVALHRQRLERTLQATPAPELMTITSASGTKSHSRRARGECGVRLGKKIDQVLAEIREHRVHEDECASSCCAPVAVMEPPAASSVDPPVPAFGGGAERAPDDSAAGGSGFPNPSPVVEDAAWMVAIEADNTDPIGDIAHLEHLLQSSSVAEGAMLFQTLHRLREALATQVTKASDAHSPVSISAMDAVLLSRVLLKRLG